MDLPKEIKEIKYVNYLPCPNWVVGNTFWVHFHGIKNEKSPPGRPIWNDV
jgi:hypothetical protein